MKKIFKGFLMSMILGIIMIAILAGGFIYATKYKITEVGSEKSPDGSYEVIFEQVGEPEFPFGATSVRFLVKSADGTLISKEDHVILDDGASFRAENWEVHWYPVGVEIILKGSEQSDDVNIIYYDKSSVFQGYTGEQATAVMQNRYGEEVSLVGLEEGVFTFTTGEFAFQAENDFRLTDNYEEKYFVHIAEKFSASHNRHIAFEAKGEDDKERYVPVISFNGRQATEQEAFCNAVCDFVEYVQQDSYITAKGITFSEISYYVDNQLQIFPLSGYLEPYDRTELYNAIYVHLETGFSCLAYSGGSYGRLYRTNDGGKTFVEVEYPSPQVYLPDGTLYNPFIMPEEVYEQEDKLYLVAGQGPDGDYYGEQGFCSGLYESGDKGITWKYLGEQEAKSRE